jgi:hypothetical protein
MALIDSEFQRRLIDDRPRALAGIPLTEEEAAVLTHMPARSFEELSRKLDRWIEQRSRTEPRAAVYSGADRWH